MLETLLVYDNTGKVYFNAVGEKSILPTPVGLPHLFFVMPNGKRLVDAQIQVDLSGETPQPILEDIPPTETKILSQGLTEATVLIATQKQQIDMQNAAISELTMLVSMQMMGGNQ